MKPLPSASQAYSIVLHEESQKQVHNNNHMSTDASAFFVNQRGAPRWTPQKKQFDNRAGHQQGTNEGKRTNLFCRYCKKTNHVKDNCYRLIGYPPHFKFNGQKQKKEGTLASYANAVQTRGILPSENSGNNLMNFITSQHYSKEQCEQLVQAFQNMQCDISSAGNSGASASANLNLAGPFNEEETSFW